MITALVVVAMGCSEDFLERPPKDQVVDGSFFQTDDQVLAATAPLYARVWFDYNDNASFNIGDVRAGVVYSPWNNRPHVEFNMTPDNPDNGAAWRSFFIVVGQSNLAMENIKRYAGAGVSEEIKKMGIAEARFMRAMAYRFLVLNWGNVPIIENNLALLTDTTKAPNTVGSVWKFITKDARAAAEDLPEVAVQPGRLTKWSAEAMLARIYLVRAGIGATPGNRNQTFLDSAKYYAQRVIELSGAQLLDNYKDLFLYPYDNNEESLFSLQWVYTGATAWGTQNSLPSRLNFSNDISNGDGWGDNVSASYWMLSQYEGFMEDGKTLDKRLYATFMLPGAHYPEISQTVRDDEGNVSEQELRVPYTPDDNRNFVYVKKYVTGKASDVGGNSASQRYGHDMYMIRLAEMYLIYAEAALGNESSINSGKGLEYFNEIRLRAGLPEVTQYNWDDVFRERIIEFAMEQMAWYDLVALSYYDPTRAYSIVSNQDRGMYLAEPDELPDPTEWTVTKREGTEARYFTATSANFLLPIPSAEINQAPNLAKEAVDYYEGN